MAIDQGSKPLLSKHPYIIARGPLASGLSSPDFHFLRK
jgi:hypothetical protein